jgi:hypothetical protein
VRQNVQSPWIVLIDGREPDAVVVAPVSANVWQIPQLQPERVCDDDVRRFNERVPREPRTFCCDDLRAL